MNNFSMFCLSMEPKHLEIIKKLDYLPVGLGNKNFSSEWFSDNTKKNISDKNKYYGEYTFHYWLWNNYLDKLKNEWIGFCQYRKFWSMHNNRTQPTSLAELESLVLNNIPESFNKYDVILGEESFTNKFKLMKFLKRGPKTIIKNPLTLISKKRRNIKFHFDIWHGSKYMEKAIKLLEKGDRNDFNDFVNLKVSFNPHNMFICNSKNILEDYYNIVFPWLERCEKSFGFEALSGYGQTRIYGFLAERFMSYWFQKNTKFTTMPIVYYDIGEFHI